MCQVHGPNYDRDVGETANGQLKSKSTRDVTVSDRRMRLTVEQYGEAIRAAFEHGYIDGLYHPHSRGVMARAQECSEAFWARVESGIREKMRPERAPVPAVDRSRSTPDAPTEAKP